MNQLLSEKAAKKENGFKYISQKVLNHYVFIQ